MNLSCIHIEISSTIIKHLFSLPGNPTYSQIKDAEIIVDDERLN